MKVRKRRQKREKKKTEIELILNFLVENGKRGERGKVLFKERKLKSEKNKERKGEKKNYEVKMSGERKMRESEDGYKA
jgi:hypothetical protein